MTLASKVDMEFASLELKTADIPSSGIFDTTAANAYAKRGIYRGFPANVNGGLAMQMCNFKLSKTRGAFADLVNTQPPLPEHG